ncbi:HNH endonuclease [Pelagibius marinus]|uniref:HNH endonuclease n=1 Tax=Pelagibius marinus TaxID=2762760 RepID=UPI001D03E46F|nr:HNH endonuclease [Pelagibius marinus]
MADESLGPCPVCGREMIEGPSVDRHHWVPKSAGGRATDDIHVVCHRMIHRVFDERELATGYADPEAVRAHPEIEAFVKWVRRKPADYIDWPKSPRKRRGR